MTVMFGLDNFFISEERVIILPLVTEKMKELIFTMNLAHINLICICFLIFPDR